ncbi:Hypothetical protein, putative [Bodo saltans]|uniref:Uncharacterized protein n=1 Tax=Bodo saltans TaxID=75058 RepID=A0A0S4IQY3_BODSA|nr:Hypothetical protein, putative [Bodo saltans]|eukprot:CUF35738.1 Hypothetical protein, putative [Bodo saltans]
MITSVNAEGPPRTPLQGFTAAHASRFSARSSSVMSGSGSSISDVLSQKSVSIRRAESVRSGSSEASHSDAIPSFPNYSFGGIAVDEDAIDRRLRERQREGGVVDARSLRVAPLTWNGSYTAFMVDETFEELADVAEVPRLSSAACTSPYDVSKSQL